MKKGKPSKLSRGKKVLITISALVLLIVIIGLALWYLPICRTTYTSNGNRIFSIGYPLRFKTTISQYGDDEYGGYFDIGKSSNSPDNGEMIHFLYNSNKSMFSTDANDNASPELSYSVIQNCDDAENYYIYRWVDGYTKGYTSKIYSGRTLCLLDYDQAMEPGITHGEFVLNPTPGGVMSIIYSKKDAATVELILRTIKFYK